MDSDGRRVNDRRGDRTGPSREDDKVFVSLEPDEYIDQLGNAFMAGFHYRHATPNALVKTYRERQIRLTDGVNGWLNDFLAGTNVDVLSAETYSAVHPPSTGTSSGGGRGTGRGSSGATPQRPV